MFQDPPTEHKHKHTPPFHQHDARGYARLITVKSVQNKKHMV